MPSRSVEAAADTPPGARQMISTAAPALGGRTGDGPRRSGFSNATATVQPRRVISVMAGPYIRKYPGSASTNRIRRSGCCMVGQEADAAAGASIASDYSVAQAYFLTAVQLT